MLVPFGSFAPDHPQYRSGGSPIISNVLPDARVPHEGASVPSYKSLNGLKALTTTAMAGRAFGARSFRDANGDGHIYAGDATSLYKIVETSFSSRTGTSFTLIDGERWEFAIFNNKVIAVGGTGEDVQESTLGSTTNFSDMITSTRKPKAKHVGVVRDHVLLGNIDDPTDGAVPNRVAWCAQGDETDFSESAQTQAGFQDLDAELGHVNRIIGGEYGVVFQDRAVSRMTKTVPPIIWQIDEVERGRGCVAPGSVVQFGNIVWYLSDDGFMRFDGRNSTPIGKHLVDKTFFQRLDTLYYDRITAVHDPINSIIIWGFAGTDASPAGTPNRYIAHNYVTMDWSEGEFDHEILFVGQGAGTTLEGLDTVSASLDALGFSLDSRQWEGSGRILAAINTSHHYAQFTDNPLTARLETQDIQPFRGQRTTLNAFRPVVESESSLSLACRVGVRDLLDETISYSAAVSVESTDGKCKVRTNGRYTRFRLDPAGGFRHALGVEVEDDDLMPGGAR